MIYQLRSIVAGIANLQDEDPLLRPAIELAERTGAMLHLVHAFELPDVAWDAYARFGMIDGPALDDYTVSVSRRLEAAARRVTTSSRVRCHAVPGPAPVVIRETALGEQADLIVVGATRHGRLARAILGTTAQRVLRGAPTPVLVLRGPLARRPERVLITTDLSEFSAGIHEAGLDVLESLFSGASLEISSMLVVSYDMQLPPPLPQDMLGEVAERRLTDFLDGRRGRARPVKGLVRFGDPAREIVAEIARSSPDLLVMGSHGRPASKRWVLGSVAEATLRSADANVLIVPAVVEAQRTLPVPRHSGAAIVSSGDGTTRLTDALQAAPASTAPARGGPVGREEVRAAPPPVGGA